MAAMKAAADYCIGSLISLTTKSGMRYEGSLVHVDAEECTIALQNVRSFGTEGRRPAFVVSPSDKIYNHVVFDGSDIKDLRVISPPIVPSLLDDPAIIESRDSLPPPMHTGLAFTGAVKAPNQQFTAAIPGLSPARPGLLTPKHMCGALSVVTMDSLPREISSVTTGFGAVSVTKEAAAAIPGLLPVPVSTSVSRKFFLPSDLLPNVAASSLSVQSSPGQFATPQSGFLPVLGPLTPNYPHGVLSGVMMGSASKTAENVSSFEHIKLSVALEPQPSGNVEEAKKV